MLPLGGIMILRHFEVKDIKDLQKYRYQDKTDLQILSMINDWRKVDSSGRFLEFMSIVNGGQMVGQIVVKECVDCGIDIGVYVFEPFRRNGFAYFGVKKILELAMEKKYDYAVFVVEKNNVAAYKLINKIGFTSKSEFINAKGTVYYNIKKKLNLE